MLPTQQWMLSQWLLVSTLVMSFLFFRLWALALWCTLATGVAHITTALLLNLSVDDVWGFQALVNRLRTMFRVFPITVVIVFAQDVASLDDENLDAYNVHIADDSDDGGHPLISYCIECQRAVVDETHCLVCHREVPDGDMRSHQSWDPLCEALRPPRRSAESPARIRRNVRPHNEPDYDSDTTIVNDELVF